MALPDLKSLNAATEGDIKLLAQWDSLGLMSGDGESFAEYKARVERHIVWQKKLMQDLKKAGKVEIAPKLYAQKDGEIPAKIFRQAHDLTQDLYGFTLDWAAGFFLTEPLGMLWGGSSWSCDESGEAVFIIRKEFRKREKWYIYERTELLAHELCHLAHAPVGGNGLEEFFAYQTSTHKLRRYMGNCFVNNWDSLFFLLPSMLLLTVQLVNLFANLNIPISPFWGLQILGVGWLLGRNQLWRNRYFKAESFLQRLNFPAKKILFRCSEEEICQIAKFKSEQQWSKFIEEKCAESFRFQVIKHRFMEEYYEA